MDRMHKINWPRALDALAKKLNPAHGPMFRGLGMSYYWSAFQTEWASHTAFTSSHALAAIYPQLTRGAIATFGSRDVPRFLGKRPDRRYQGEAPRDYKDRPEGVRIKHQAYRNSVQAYDKSGSVLRVETTITNPGAFQSYRSSQGDPDGPKSWRQMRKGVADMHRRAEVSQQCNQRYAAALASLDTSGRSSSWRPRCVVRRERTAGVTVPCGPGPSRIGNYWSRSATAPSRWKASAIAIWPPVSTGRSRRTESSEVGSRRRFPIVFASFGRTV